MKLKYHIALFMIDRWANAKRRWNVFKIKWFRVRCKLWCILYNHQFKFYDKQQLLVKINPKYFIKRKEIQIIFAGLSLCDPDISNLQDSKAFINITSTLVYILKRNIISNPMIHQILKYPEYPMLVIWFDTSESDRNISDIHPRLTMVDFSKNKDLIHNSYFSKAEITFDEHSSIAIADTR